MTVGRDLRLDERNAGEREWQHRARAFDIERGSAAGSEAVFCETDGLPLYLGVSQGDRELALRATQLEVGARDLRRERHLHIFQRVFGRRDQSALCAHAAAYAAEDVELPRGVEPDVVEIALR